MASKARIKGNKNRRKSIEYLESLGWTVGIVERTGRFVTPKDLFSLFDLCCVRYNTVLFVQISTNQNHPHKPYKEFRSKYFSQDNEKFQIIQLTWIDHEKKPRIFTY